jgi:hypothetical protein
LEQVFVTSFSLPSLFSQRSKCSHGIPTDAYRCWTGWSGLSLAKTYTQAHPDADLIVLETADSVGGVWAAHRLYPGLRTNSILGSYENPDFPMTVEKFGVKPGEHIPGTVVHQYMTDFAKTFDIWRRIRFRTKVEEIQQAENGKWILKLTTFRSTNGEETMETKSITADKVVIATGVTGNPNMPDITGADTFDAPLFHAKDFLQNKELLKTANKVVVYGGSKSAVRTAFVFQISVSTMSFKDGDIADTSADLPLLVGCCICLQYLWNPGRVGHQRVRRWPLLDVSHLGDAAEKVLGAPGVDSALEPLHSHFPGQWRRL